MAIDVNSSRWKRSLAYLKALPLAEKRRFFSKCLKYMLNESDWDDSIRSPTPSDHANMRDMILAFNDQTKSIMQGKRTPDVQHQWHIVRFIKKGKKARVRKRQISRLTGEFMMIIKMCHPVRREGKKRVKDRVRCMSDIQKEAKRKYFQ